MKKGSDWVCRAEAEVFSSDVCMIEFLKTNYSHLKRERYSRYLKPLDLKIHSYGGLVVSFKYILTKPENSKKQIQFFPPPEDMNKLQ